MTESTPCGRLKITWQDDDALTIEALDSQGRTLMHGVCEAGPGAWIQVAISGENLRLAPAADGRWERGDRGHWYDREEIGNAPWSINDCVEIHGRMLRECDRSSIDPALMRTYAWRSNLEPEFDRVTAGTANPADLWEICRVLSNFLRVDHYWLATGRHP